MEQSDTFLLSKCQLKTEKSELEKTCTDGNKVTLGKMLMLLGQNNSDVGKCPTQVGLKIIDAIPFCFIFLHTSTLPTTNTQTVLDLTCKCWQ